MANMKDTHRMRMYPPTPEHVAITKSVQEVEDMFTQDIRETLYADGVGIVSVVEKLNERTVINKHGIVHPTQAYLEAQKNGNGIRLDAVAYGSQGNDIKFFCSNGAALRVMVEGETIAVEAPLATTTISAVVTAINADTDANKLVTASVIGNGSTLMIAVPETPLAGGVDVTHGEDGEVFFDSVNIYVSDGESKEDEDNWLSAPLLPTLPTVIDLSDATKDYVIEDGKNSIVVLTDNAATAKDIILPAAIVGLRVTIINQDNASVDIRPAAGEYLNGSGGTPFTLTTLNSATFYCYADGFWAII
jgi:hypothetical protein